MKHLHKAAVISILLVFAVMVAAVAGFQKEEDPSTQSTEHVEYYLPHDWTIGILDHIQVSEAGWNDPDNMRKLVKSVWMGGKSQDADLPYQGTSSPGDVVIYKRMIPEEDTGRKIRFFTQDSSVQVYLDGEMVYHSRYGAEDDAEETDGRKEHIVQIPKITGTGDLWVLLWSNEPDAAARLDMVMMELQEIVLVGVFGNDIVDIVCCLLIGFMAVAVLAIALIRWYTRLPGRGELYLGLACLLAGIYCFIGTDTLSIFYNLEEAYAMQEYLVLLLPLLMTLYYDRNLRSVYPRRFLVLLSVICLHTGGQILMHLLGVRDVKEMSGLSAAAVGLVGTVAIISLVQYGRGHRTSRIWVSTLAMAILLASGAANLVLYAVSKRLYVRTAGQYSITVFSLLMAVQHIFRLAQEHRADVEERAQEAERQNRLLAQAKEDADAARVEALAANEAKGRFLAHMSHEIRTPINAVLGMDEMILRESKEQSIRAYAMDIYQAGQTLLSLINDILDFSRIDSGKMEIVPVEYDISSLIHDLVNMASQRAGEKQLRLVVQVDPNIPSRLYGDDVRIRQVLTNILTNAVKYTSEGTVWLRVKSRCIDDQAVLSFEVEDTGIGIREEDLPKLTAEFERIEEDRNRNIEGTGLGMSITLQLLALMGSKMQVESVYGKGSKFSFELEQKIINHTPVGDFEARVRLLSQDYSHKATLFAPDADILVVDDNAVNRKVLRSLLKETQMRITDAESGMQCLELVQRQHYDLILLDHMMPEMDGIETLHRIRGLPDGPCRDTPVVVLTANAVAGAKEAYLAEGFDDFLSKPVVPEKLEQMIRNMLPEELLRDAADPGEGNTSTQPAQTDAKAGPPEGLPQVDGLDWQYAWLHLPQIGLLEYTVKEFYAQIHAAADRLEQALIRMTDDRQYLEAYRIQVHAMKSLAATVGIVPLAGIAKILEYAAKDANIERIVSVTPVFLDEWRSYGQKLQGVFGIGMQTEQKKEITDGSVIQALVQMLRLSVQEMEIDQADERMRQLLEYHYPQEADKTVQKLAEAVNSLDQEETDRLADVLAGQILQLSEDTSGQTQQWAEDAPAQMQQPADVPVME